MGFCQIETNETWRLIYYFGIRLSRAILESGLWKTSGLNWYGGHSGRRLTDDDATRLDMIWLEYIHSNPRMFAEGNATISEWCGVLLSEAMEEALRAQLPCECEVCGYSYRKAFGRDMDWHNYISPIPSQRLPTLFHTICRSCDEVEDEKIEEVLLRKSGVV